MHKHNDNGNPIIPQARACNGVQDDPTPSPSPSNGEGNALRDLPMEDMLQVLYLVALLLGGDES